MGSTTSGGAVEEESAKDKKDSGKKKATRKTASKKTRSPTTTVKKKAATGKKAAASKKLPGKKATAKKKAPGKKASARKKSAKKPDKHADVAPAAGTAPGPVGATAVATAEGDSKSLSWMAAQAASALKAVRENQNERAQALLAKAEITPATPVKPGKKSGTRTEPDLSATGKAAKAGKTKPPVKGKTAGAAPAEKAENRKNKQPGITPEAVRAGTGKDTTTDTMPEPVKAAAIPAVNEPSTDMAAEPAAPQAPAASKPEASGDQQAVTPPADVIAATSTATGNRRSLRPFLITGFIVLIGVLGARAWFSDDDTADIAVIQEGVEAEQVTAVTARPQITVVAAEPAEQPATDNAPQTENLSPATTTAGPEPADDTRQALQTIEPVPPETPTPQPQVVTQSPAAAPQAAGRPAPRPGYYAPAYGYYPQQPVRQQPYYRPAY
jgi:hypothetical protein